MTEPRKEIANWVDLEILLHETICPRARFEQTRKRGPSTRSRAVVRYAGWDYCLRVAVQRPSVRPSIFMRPVPESLSIQPARVAVTEPGSCGHEPLTVSST